MSYDDSLLGSSALYRVRLEIGDTDTNRHLLSDNEVNHVLNQTSDDETMAALECVRRILAKLGRDYDRSTGSTSNSRSQKTQFYRDLLKDLRMKVGSQANIELTGHSKSEVDGLLSDSDFPRPSFRVGMNDHTGANQHPDWDDDDC